MRESLLARTMEGTPSRPPITLTRHLLAISHRALRNLLEGVQTMEESFSTKPMTGRNCPLKHSIAEVGHRSGH